MDGIEETTIDGLIGYYYWMIYGGSK